MMNTVVLEVRSLGETLKDAARVLKSRRGERAARISFATPELLWEVLTAKRWELLKALRGVGPVSIAKPRVASVATSRQSTATSSRCSRLECWIGPRMVGSSSLSTP
jgi:predicted transcriptional regulator